MQAETLESTSSSPPYFDLVKIYTETRNGIYSTKFSPWLTTGSLSLRFIYEEVERYESERGWQMIQHTGSCSSYGEITSGFCQSNAGTQFSIWIKYLFLPFLFFAAYLAYGIPHSSLRIALFHKAAYNIGGLVISANAIEHSIFCFLTTRVGWDLELFCVLPYLAALQNQANIRIMTVAVAVAVAVCFC